MQGGGGAEPCGRVGPLRGSVAPAEHLPYSIVDLGS